MMQSRLPFPALLAAALLAWLPSHAVRGADKAAPSLPERHEAWVPSKDLESILRKHPNAVLLDRAQYEALIRDAGRVRPDEDAKAPVPSVIEGVKLRLEIAGGAPAMLVDAKLTVFSLVDTWSEVKLLDLPPGVVPTQFDGEGIPRRPDAKNDRALHLLVRGKGRHEIGMQFHSPILRAQGICQAAVPYLARPFSISAVAGEGVRFDGSWPVKDGVATAPVFDVLMKSGGSDIGWMEAPAGSMAEPVVTQHAECLTNVRAGELVTWHRMYLSSAQGPLPEVLRFRLANAATQVTNVGWWKPRGTSPAPGNVAGSVNEAAWTQAGNVLEITRRSGFMRAGWFCFETTTPIPDATTTTAIELEVPRLEGAARVGADLALDFGDALQMAGWQTPGSPPPPDFIAYQQSQRDANRKDASVYLTHYESAPARVLVNIRRAGDLYSADVDLQALVTQHDLQLTRTVAFHGEEGGVRRAVFSLPAGEQFLSLAFASGEAIEWKQTEGASPALEITWPGILSKGKTSTILVGTRKELPPAGVNPPPSLMVENLAMPGATRLAGYVALDFDESWKVATTDTPGLESRDARHTPVQGRMAWFHLRDYRLGVELSRHEAVLDAAITAYALPRARTVEIEGQLVIEALRAPLRKFTVKLPVAAAPLLRWDSPLIGEHTLDAATGVWTVALRKELLGVATLRWHLSLPGEVKAEGGGANAESNATSPNAMLAATLPRFELPTARRFSGAWVIEANTDTELSFETKGLQPLDALRAPRVEGYAPRHRVLAAYGHGSAESELRVTATRHESARLVSAVVEMLTLTSVLARDGTARHEAVMRVRHSGDQFFAMKLPSGGVLLSTTVERGVVKPVTAGPGEVRVPLPRRQGGSAVALIAVLYETKADRWGGGGKAALQPPAFDATVPVLTTSWRVVTPEGYSFGEPDTTLTNALRTRGQDSLAGAVADAFDRLVGQMHYSRVDFLPGGYRKQAVQMTAAEYADAANSLVLAQIADAPRPSPDHLTRFYQVPPAVWDDAMPKTYFGSPPGPVQALQGLGVNPPQGSTVEYDRRTSRLTVRSDLRTLDAVTNALSRVRPAEGGATSYVHPYEERMSKIIFPRIQFTGATIEEALEYLRIKSRDYDSKEGDPSKRGISMIIKPGVAPSTATISLDLKDVPMNEALRYITQLAGMKYTVEPYAVVITPVSDASVSTGKLAAAKSGLLPVKLDLPASGRVFEFRGNQKPEMLTLRYQSWERQMAKACFWMLAGLALFWCFGRRRPWWRTFVVALALTCVPIALLPSWLSVCNALLAGWLLGLVVWLLRCAARWIEAKAQTHEGRAFA